MHFGDYNELLSLQLCVFIRSWLHCRYPLVPMTTPYKKQFTLVRSGKMSVLYLVPQKYRESARRRFSSWATWVWLDIDLTNVVGFRSSKLFSRLCPIKLSGNSTSKQLVNLSFSLFSLLDIFLSIPGSSCPNLSFPLGIRVRGKHGTFLQIPMPSQSCIRCHYSFVCFTPHLPLIIKIKKKINKLKCRSKTVPLFRRECKDLHWWQSLAQCSGGGGDKNQNLHKKWGTCPRSLVTCLATYSVA